MIILCTMRPISSSKNGVFCSPLVATLCSVLDKTDYSMIPSIKLLSQSVQEIWSLHYESDPDGKLYMKYHHLSGDGVFNLASNFDSRAAITEYIR